MVKLFYSLFVIAITLTGCVWPGTNVKLKPDFWEHKTTKIAIEVTPYPIRGKTYIENSDPYSLERYPEHERFNQFPLFPYVKLDTGLTQFIKRFDYSEAFNIKSVFANELTKRGMLVSLIEDKKLNLFSSIHTGTKEHAMKTLKEQTDADFLILFNVELCGVIEKNLIIPTPPILPIKRPLYAAFFVKGYLINLHNGNVEWMFYHNDHKDIVPLPEKDWNQPPDYPNVAKALREVIAISSRELLESFFN